MDFTRPFRRRCIAGVGWVKLAPGSGADPQEAVERVLHARRMVCVVDDDGAAVWQDVDGGWRVVVWTAANAPPAPDADPLVDASDASTSGFKVGAPSAWTALLDD